MTDLLLCSDFPPMGGGIARWMAAMAEHYPAGQLVISTGAWPTAAASDQQLAQRVDRVKVRTNRLRTVLGVRTWSRRAVALAHEFSPAFAWCDTVRPAGYVGNRVHRRSGVPYGIMAVGNDIITLRAKLRRSAWRRHVMRGVIGDSAVVVAISRWTAAECVSLMDELEIEGGAGKVRVVTLGTDPARFEAASRHAAAFRSGRTLPQGRWLVTVARLESYKGIDTAIEVMARLAPVYSDLHYAVVGRGPDEGRLRDLARRSGVADRVHFLTDVGDGELPGAYALGQVYLGLTRETSDSVEGFGLSLVEASASGVPVVASRSGGIPDAVSDEVSGILVAENDPAAAAEAVRRLLEDPVTAARLGAGGRELVARRHNWARVVNEMYLIARELGSNN